MAAVIARLQRVGLIDRLPQAYADPEQEARSSGRAGDEVVGICSGGHLLAGSGLRR